MSAEALLATIVDCADDAILSKDLNGNITSWNRGAERIFGYTAEEMIGEPVFRLLPSDRHEEEREILRRLQAGQMVDHFETVRMRKSGEIFPVLVTISPLRDAAGGIIGAFTVARDLSVLHHSTELRSLLSAIVDSSDDAIVSKSLEGIVTSWNRGAERVFGYAAAEMVGQPILRIFPADRVEEEPGILERLQRGVRVDHFETKRVRKDGRIIDVSVTISPIRDSSGRIIGASKIARDITEQKLAEANLIRINEELRLADRMKSEFLATLSHELRTPLNAILGWTHVLRSGPGDAEELAHGLDVIERNARAQAQMIQDLLDVSRIVSGKMVLDVQPLDLPAVVEAAMQSLVPAAQARDIRMVSTFASVEGIVMGDRNRLQQVVWNLLSNALKFTPKRGRVHVTIERRNSHVEIAVADTGQGIRPEFLPYVFERFRQADGSTTRSHGGLGLGLSIVKQLVEMHGGETRAFSEGEGRGATFTILLPIMASRAVTGPGAAALAGSLPAPLQGVLVLSVDDAEDSSELLQRILSARGATVLSANSAAEAIRLLDTHTPDIVLSDIGMPEQDGYAFIRQLRQIPRFASTPAVALTALARTEDRTRALQAGFQTHVTKPVEAEELVAVVASLISIGRRVRGGGRAAGGSGAVGRD